MLARLAVLGVIAVAGAQDLDLPEPRLLAPRADDKDVVQPVEFRWTPVRGAASYQIQISRTESFEPPLVADQSVNGLRFDPVVLPAVTLWWRVRAVDGSGKHGRWTGPRKFEFRPLAPAPPVAAVTLTPVNLSGGFPSEGLVTVTSPAPPGGARVDLSSSDPDAASVPAHVNVASGATTATFTVDTHTVTEIRQVRITAGSLGPARSAGLTVVPLPPAAELLSCSIYPSVLTGGNVAQGTVRLSKAAPPPRGVAVELNSADAGFVLVPATVTVPAGERMVSFPIRTTTPGVSRLITITASLAGSTRTAGLTLEGSASGALPAPELQSPAPDQTFPHSEAVLFRWSSVPGAASYTVQVDGTASFSGPVFVNYTLPDLETRVSPFTGRLYWWRVRANNGKGVPGEWSTAREFQVE